VRTLPDLANGASVVDDAPANPIAADGPVRVLVIGIAWPPETFIERLLDGLSQQPRVALTIASSRRPPTGWLERTGSAWLGLPSGSRRADARLLAPYLAPAVRQGSLSVDRLAAVALGRANSASLRGDLAFHHLETGGFDVAYVPWINTLTEHPRILDAAVPIVTSCRGSLITIAPFVEGADRYRAELATVFDRVHAVHCVSHAIVGDAVALGLDPAKATVITPAVPAAAFTASDHTRRGGRLDLIAVGSLTWRKGYEHAVVALADARARGVDAHLTIIGDGPERQRVRYTAFDLGVADHLTLTGTLPADDVARHLRRADLFVHPSSNEGISNAVLEAMATGLAVVVAESGGMAEAVTSGHDGLLVPVGDRGALADAIVLLAADDALRVDLGRNARARIGRDFDISRQIAGFVGLFEAARERTDR